MQAQGASKDQDGLAGHFGFLSYSHADLAAANELRERLRAVGLDAFKDDFSIRSGDRWFEALENAISRSEWFLVLVGRDGFAGWVGAETQLALSRHFSARKKEAPGLPFVPLLLADASVESLPPFLSLFQVARWAPGRDLPADLPQALRTTQPNQAASPLAPDTCPYRGLSAFRLQDSHLFFGRSEETLHAISLLGDRSAHPANPERSSSQSVGRDYRRWLQVEGNSGSGKSSLVQAGMLPMVERGALWPRTGILKWRIVGPMLPGIDPTTNLAEALGRALRAEHESQALPDLQDLRDRLLGADTTALALLLRQYRPRLGGRFLLVVDQFEELITFADGRARAAFDAQLANALSDPECPLFLVSTIRNDFLDRLDLLPRLTELYPHQCERYPLPAIGHEGLREAIEMPSRLARVDTSEVAAQILADARDEPGALPLAENALTALWLEAQTDTQGRRRLSAELYERRGGLAGMLSQDADALLERIELEWPGKGRRAALEALLALTRINPDGRNTRQRLPYEEVVRAADNGRLSPAGEKVVRLLAGERSPGEPSDRPSQVLRLVTIEGAPDGTGPSGRSVDLVHETLIRARGSGPHLQPYWPTLYRYVHENRDRPLKRQQLAFRAERWQGASKLTRWRHLALAGGWWELRKLGVARASLEGRFLAASQRASAALALVFVLAAAAAFELVLSLDSRGLPPGYGVGTRLMWYAGQGPIPEVVSLPPGSFDPGCKPGRDDVYGARCSRGEVEAPVSLDRPCEIGKFEVTFEQYDYYVWATRGGESGEVFFPKDGGSGRGALPVVNLNWRDAQLYLRWLSGRTGRTWRLPTEREWEYAARAGNRTDAFWWGAEIQEGQLNCSGCDERLGGQRAARVGSYACNPFGVCDATGNVWERVQDPLGSSADASGVLRGGSWRYGPLFARIASRIEVDPGLRQDDIGFRACRDALR